MSVYLPLPTKPAQFLISKFCIRCTHTHKRNPLGCEVKLPAQPTLAMLGKALPAVVPAPVEGLRKACVTLLPSRSLFPGSWPRCPPPREALACVPSACAQWGWRVPPTAGHTEPREPEKIRGKGRSARSSRAGQQARRARLLPPPLLRCWHPAELPTCFGAPRGSQTP